MADEKRPAPPPAKPINEGYKPVEKGWKPIVQGGYKPAVGTVSSSPPTG